MDLHKFGIVVVLLVLVALATLPYRPALTTVNGLTGSKVQSLKVSPQANTVIIHLVGFIGAWNSSTNSNPTIAVTQGDMVSISLVSGDGAGHRFLLDIDKDGVTDISDCGTVDPCSTVFPPSTSDSFTAASPGTFTYYCVVHPTTMVGNFVVIAPAASGGGGATRLYQK